MQDPYSGVTGVLVSSASRASATVKRLVVRGRCTRAARSASSLRSAPSASKRPRTWARVAGLHHRHRGMLARLTVLHLFRRNRKESCRSLKCCRERFEWGFSGLVVCIQYTARGRYARLHISSRSHDVIPPTGPNTGLHVKEPKCEPSAIVCARFPLLPAAVVVRTCSVEVLGQLFCRGVKIRLISTQEDAPSTFSAFRWRRKLQDKCVRCSTCWQRLPSHHLMRACRQRARADRMS